MSNIEYIERLKQLANINTHIVVAVVGDPTKTALLPLWGKVSEMPGAWVNTYTYEAKSSASATALICNIWDINAGCLVHMYPSSSVDHSIIVCDMEYRYREGKNRKQQLRTIDDYIKQVNTMCGETGCATCIILYENKENYLSEISYIRKKCRKAKIGNIYLVCNNSENIGSLSNLIRDRSYDIYNHRCQTAQSALKLAISEGPSMGTP